MLKEAQRVLKVGGVYIAISYGDPESREFHFFREFLSFDLKTFSLKEEEGSQEAGKTHYVYVCTKNPDADEICAKYYQYVIEKLGYEAKQEKLFAIKHGMDGDASDKEERKKPEKKNKYRSKSE